MKEINYKIIFLQKIILIQKIHFIFKKNFYNKKETISIIYKCNKQDLRLETLNNKKFKANP